MTSTVADSALDICSRAFVLIGADTITSFDDGSTEAVVATNMYEDIVRTALSNTRWRFATNQATLNLLSSAPTGRYDRAYQLPSDLLMLHAITVNDHLIEYQVYGDKAYANTTATDSLIADYTFRAGEDKFPSYFTLAVEYSLAVAFATSVARDAAMAQQMMVMAQQTMAKARSLDAQQQTTRKLSTSRFVTNRR
ncbi:MAG: hypothetical protein Tp139DCM904402_7 [Prokaryotic dsDNA virus sp.]|jgi:hypothetical protein|nr:MAG: hypothetical protein Tp139DCM904402_7 [Prokaryotic dsDNA virus sp.]|tara:strand:+ start:361 stop:945 length:585 start_codon:yes stop_codon:yes gene_type:complete